MILRITLSLLLSFTAALTAVAQERAGQANYQEGVQYVTLEEPVRPRQRDKIEVVEIFWYGCHHCYTLEAPLEAWKRQLADDVDFWRSPVVWNPLTELHARAFYVAQALGVQEQLHGALFKALNVDRNPLNSEKALRDFFVKQAGIEEQAFDKAFGAFGVTSQVNQAKARMLSYKVQGTPTLIVNGKYRVTGQGVADQAEQLQVVNYLIARERAAAGLKN